MGTSTLKISGLTSKKLSEKCPWKVFGVSLAEPNLCGGLPSGCVSTVADNRMKSEKKNPGWVGH